MDTGAKIVAVIGTIFSVIFYSVALYGQVAEQHDTVLYMKSDYAGITTVVLNDNSYTFDLDIVFVESDVLANVSWNAIKFGILNDQNAILPEITVSNSLNGNVLTIAITQAEFTPEVEMMGELACQINVQLSKGYTYEINTAKETGDINLVADEVDFTTLNLVQSTGSTKIVLSDLKIAGNIAVKTNTGNQELVLTNSIVQGNIGMETNTGSQDLILTDMNLQGNISMIGSTSNADLIITNSTIGQSIYSDRSTGDLSMILREVTFTNNVQITQSESTGDFNLIWEQKVALTKNVTIQSSTSTGSQNMDFKIPYNSVKYQIQASADTGSVNINSEGYDNNENHSSDNSNTTGLALVDIDATASTGSIDIKYSK